MLTHGDHKRIALAVAAELQKVLGDHAGSRLLSRHGKPPADPTMDMTPEEMAAMEEEGEPAGLQDEPGEPDAMDASIGQLRRFKKRGGAAPAKGGKMPPGMKHGGGKHGGMGM